MLRAAALAPLLLFLQGALGDNRKGEHRSGANTQQLGALGFSKSLKVPEIRFLTCRTPIPRLPEEFRESTFSKSSSPMQFSATPTEDALVNLKRQ